MGLIINRLEMVVLPNSSLWYYIFIYGMVTKPNWNDNDTLEIMEKYIYRAKLDRVVDGDTVDAMIDLGFNTWVKRRIRFHGLDTWECRTRNLEEKKKGLAAKARTKELLTQVTSKPGYFRVKSHGVGKYGRVLGELFIKDTEDNQININETLMEEGHAHSYHGEKKKKYENK
tara:strand:+ start:138 stop:653 length:516 start_codon:yes stop_codon:yes gene_type:complete